MRRRARYAEPDLAFIVCSKQGIDSGEYPSPRIGCDCNLGSLVMCSCIERSRIVQAEERRTIRQLVAVGI